MVIPANESVSQLKNHEPVQERKVTLEPEMVYPPFELNPNESFTVRKDEQTRDASRQERTSKIVKKQVPKTTDAAEPLGSWFHRQFGGFFNEDDTEIDK